VVRVISSDLLLALLGGALAGGGVLLLIASLIGWAPREAAGPTLTDRLAPADIGRRLLLGGGLALVALLASGWLVVAVGVGLLGFFATKLFGGASARSGRGAAAGGARVLDRVAPGHDRRRGRAGAGDPGVVQRRGADPQAAAGRC
jgi:hypothetical protein